MEAAGCTLNKSDSLPGCHSWGSAGIKKLLGNLPFMKKRYEASLRKEEGRKSYKTQSVGLLPQ